MTSKRELERELYFCQAKVEQLEKQLEAAKLDREYQQQQIRMLQDAVLSMRAPDAYQDMKSEEADAKRIPPSPEEVERNRVTREFTKHYLNNMETPLFKTGDDLDDLITTGLIRDIEPPDSLHGNDES